MKKLPAFTVAELLVVAILSLLIASAAFSVIRIFNQQYSTYQADHDRSVELDELYSWLQWDCFNAEKMEIMEGGLIFKFFDKSISYQTKDQEIYRKIKSENVLLRKFKIKIEQINGFLEGKEIDEGMIDEVQIKLIFLEKEISFILRKEYSAKELISADAYKN